MNVRRIECVGQMSLFDMFPMWDEPSDAANEEDPEIGQTTTVAGRILCHIMLRSHVGKKVLFDVHTQSMPVLWKCGILEQYFHFEHDRVWIAAIYTGKAQRTLLKWYDGHKDGVEIWETVAAKKEWQKQFCNQTAKKGGMNEHDRLLQG